MKQKTPKLGAETRDQISETLPRALEKALTSYQDFIDEQSNLDHIEYKNKQTAARAGLAHIELLIKLAGTVELLDDNKTQDFVAMLSRANKELEGQNE